MNICCFYVSKTHCSFLWGWLEFSWWTVHSCSQSCSEGFQSSPGQLREWGWQAKQEWMESVPQEFEFWREWYGDGKLLVSIHGRCRENTDEYCSFGSQNWPVPFPSEVWFSSFFVSLQIPISFQINSHLHLSFSLSPSSAVPYLINLARIHFWWLQPKTPKWIQKDHRTLTL